MPCQGALSQAALAAACRNTNWEVKQRSGFNELPCCNSNSLVLFTDTLLMRCLSEGKLGWGRRGRAAIQRGRRRPPHPLRPSSQQDLDLWLRQSVGCMQVMRVEPSCLPQTVHRFPRWWLRVPSPCLPTWTEPLKSSASTLLRAHIPCSLYPSSHPSGLPSFPSCWHSSEPVLGEVCPGHSASHLGSSVMILSLGQLGKPDLRSRIT